MDSQLYLLPERNRAISRRPSQPRHLCLYRFRGDTSTGQHTVPDFFDIVSLFSAVTEVPLEDAINHVGTAADLASAAYDNTYQSDGIRSATLYTDQKFYLELNGMEV